MQYTYVPQRFCIEKKNGYKLKANSNVLVLSTQTAEKSLI